jgi:hypothetical protein
MDPPTAVTSPFTSVSNPQCACRKSVTESAYGVDIEPAPPLGGRLVPSPQPPFPRAVSQ